MEKAKNSEEVMRKETAQADGPVKESPRQLKPTEVFNVEGETTRWRLVLLEDPASDEKGSALEFVAGKDSMGSPKWEHWRNANERLKAEGIRVVADFAAINWRQHQLELEENQGPMASTLPPGSVIEQGTVLDVARADGSMVRLHRIICCPNPRCGKGYEVTREQLRLECEGWRDLGWRCESCGQEWKPYANTSPANVAGQLDNAALAYLYNLIGDLSLISQGAPPPSGVAAWAQTASAELTRLVSFPLEMLGTLHAEALAPRKLGDRPCIPKKTRHALEQGLVDNLLAMVQDNIKTGIPIVFWMPMKEQVNGTWRPHTWIRTPEGISWRFGPPGTLNTKEDVFRLNPFGETGSRVVFEAQPPAPPFKDDGTGRFELVTELTSIPEPISRGGAWCWRLSLRFIQLISGRQLLELPDAAAK